MTSNDEIPTPFNLGERPDPALEPADGPSLAPDSPAVASGRAAPTATRSRGLKVAAIGTIVAGGLAAAAIIGPLAADAASPSPAASTAPSATSNPPTDGGTWAPGGPGHDGGPGGFGHNEAVSDTSVAATAIGITEADLLTALQNGQTVADVAKANNVDVQKVIDALVQDGLDELAARVKAGTLTQAQADALKDQVTQRATDQVNGTFAGRGPH